MSIVRSVLFDVLVVFLVGVSATRLGDEDYHAEVERSYQYGADVPSGAQCDDENWGNDAVQGNKEIKHYLDTCTDEVEITASSLQSLAEVGCQHKFDVVSWYNISGLQQPHRAPKTGGIYCAKAYKFKKHAPPQCIQEDHDYKLTLYAPASGERGPRAVELPALENGEGLNWLQSNYTYWLGLHPRGWASRGLLRRGMVLCEKWNALDTEIQIVAKETAQESDVHFIVGPSDASSGVCGKGKNHEFIKSQTLKTLICIYPMMNYFKAIDVQAIHWHPARESASPGN